MSSVKFEKETTRSTGGKEDFMHNVGEALTKSTGPNGYLAVCITATRLAWENARHRLDIRAKLTLYAT